MGLFKRIIEKKMVPRRKKSVKNVTSQRRKVVRRVVTLKAGLALSGAVKDLELEIRRLSKERMLAKKSLRSVLSSVDVDRRREKELQQKIARLIEEEAKLNDNKKKLQVRIDRLSDKIMKITKIRSEMVEV